MTESSLSNCHPFEALIRAAIRNSAYGQQKPPRQSEKALETTLSVGFLKSAGMLLPETALKAASLEEELRENT